MCFWVRSNFGVRVGRHKACPYRGHGGRLRGTKWVGDRWHRQQARYTAPTWHGVWGALRGESPRTREGRRPDRTELQWSVISSQRRWQLRCSGTRIGFSLVVTRGVGKFTPNLDCTLFAGRLHLNWVRTLKFCRILLQVGVRHKGRQLAVWGLSFEQGCESGSARCCTLS